MPNKLIGKIIIGATIVGGLILGAMSTTHIPQGHTGVVFSLASGVQEHTLDQGLRFVGPLARVTHFPTSTESVYVPTFNVVTRDGKHLEVDMNYDFSVKADQVSHVFEKFRGQSIGNIQDSWLRSRAMRSALNVFSRYSVLDVFQNLARIQYDVLEEFYSLVQDYGFDVMMVTISAPEMDGETANAIQQVVNAQQRLEQMEIERQQAEVLANTRIEEARGRADSVRIEAEAQAEANKLLQESLTPELIQMEIARNWSGDLPMVQGSNGTILNIPSDMFGE